MNQQKNTRLVRFLVAVVIGATAGLGVSLYLRLGSGDAGGPGGFWGSTNTGPSAENSEQLNAIWSYVHALQQGDWDQAIDQTAWMEERLRYARSRTGEAGAEADARRTLRLQLSNRDIEGNRLTLEGVEDQYIFVPDATLRYTGSDAGAEDLEAPVIERAWIEVTYESRAGALLDEDALPIRQLRVGINASAAGKILKANIIGNLEIDWDSVSNDWGTAPGGQ